MNRPALDQSADRPVRVLIVDDSAIVRGVLQKVFEGCPDIEVVGTAADPYVARKKIKALNPDVLTLDIEMPRMNGLDFLRNLMRLRPMPVVMVSSLTQRGAKAALEALDIGAVDYVPKPELQMHDALADHADELIAKVIAASRVRVDRMPLHEEAGETMEKAAQNARKRSRQLVAIGASTGGTVAVREVLKGMRPDSPAALIVQHIPEVFVAQFVQGLNRSVPLQVFVAEQGQPIEDGCAYVAPPEHHLLVARDKGGFVCEISDAPPVGYHRPAATVLMRSVAEQVGRNAVGVLLTGMGDDGADGLADIRRHGGHTIVQDELSSVVWGMPKAAIELDAAEAIVPLDEIAEKVRFFQAAARLGNH